MDSAEHSFTNHLINESSPYLLQHAHNPVDWFPWGDDAFNKAKEENKLIIVSIGYAACHWCHVMERESFEDETVAGYMNDHFVAVKVDREERPDIDQVYMNAVQLLTGGGGWPLNCVALPDGRPVYGGTYFPKEQWIAMLARVLDFVKQNPDMAERHAQALTQGVRSAEIIYANTAKAEFTIHDLDRIFASWKGTIDHVNGGFKGAPKFPMPVGYQFLLHYYYLTRNKEALDAVTTTLHKIAGGGIYDQIGGGFSRYSTDEYWRVPHFEKMLYDNAQLVSLYSSAYQLTGDPLYEGVVSETLDFIESEMTSEEGGFYSSLDADSEGEEGRFYTWTYDELREKLGEHAEFVIDYYNVTEKGNWENGRNILFRSASDKEMADKYAVREGELKKRILEAKRLLLKERAKRVRPGLDDKILTAWNALMLKAYIDAYRVFDNKIYLDKALASAGFINAKMRSPDDRLSRTHMKGTTSINAFLDDYAFTIQAFISLYQATFDEKWLEDARRLMSYAVAHFYDKRSGIFYYTSDIDPPLIARKAEVIDNVIPSSNSEMAKNLFALGIYYGDDDYIRKSKHMSGRVKQDAMTGGVHYANWDYLMAWFAGRPFETAIVGESFEDRRKEFDRHYLPGIFLSGGAREGALPSLEGKLVEGQTTIYVCRDRVCNIPVTTVAEALKQIAT